VTPEGCIAFGQACKNAGVPCCAGLACSSGQEGEFPVACFKAAGTACAATAECGFGMTCEQGICVAIPTPPPPVECVPEGGACAAAADCCDGLPCVGGTCRPPACVSDGECAGGVCWYPQGSDGAPVPGEPGLQRVCVAATGGACGGNEDCGLGNRCAAGACVASGGEAMPLSVPTAGTGCGGSVDCYSTDDTCDSGTCLTEISQPCTAIGARTVCVGASLCQARGNSTATGTYCLLPDGEVCTAGGDCAGNTCADDGNHGGELVCLSCTVGNGASPYTLAEALAGSFATITVAPGIYYSDSDSTPLMTVSRSVTVEACVADDPPILWGFDESATGPIVRIETPDGGSTVTLRNLELGSGDGTKSLAPFVAVGGDTAADKLTLTLDNFNATFSDTAVTGSLVMDDGHLDATLKDCEFLGAGVHAVSTRTTDKNRITVENSTIYGHGSPASNVCPNPAGSPRGFDVENVELTLDYGRVGFFTPPAGENGAGIRARGGVAIVMRNASLILANTARADLTDPNNPVGGKGGGIYMDQGTAAGANTLTIASSSGYYGIRQNYAYGTQRGSTNGPGIYLTAAPTAGVLTGVSTTTVLGNEGGCGGTTACYQCWYGDANTGEACVASCPP